MDGCKRRALVAKVSRELSDSDCRQLCYIYLKSESCPCLKQGNHLTALNELKKKGHFSLTDEGLKYLASCLEEIERVDLANLVRQSTSYSVQCEAAITKLERSLTDLSPKLSEAEKPAIAQQLQRAVERVLEDSLKVREPDTLTVAREESSFGARGRSRLAAERDSAASQKNEGPHCGIGGKQGKLLAAAQGKRPMFPPGKKQTKPAINPAVQKVQEQSPPPQTPPPPPPQATTLSSTDLTDRDYDDITTEPVAANRSQESASLYYVKTDLLADREDLQHHHPQPLPTTESHTRRVARECENADDVSRSCPSSPNPSHGRRLGMVRRSKPSRIPPPRVLRSRSSSNLLESDADVPADSSGGYDSGYTGSSSSGSGENVQQWRRHRLSTGHDEAIRIRLKPQEPQVYTQLSHATKDEDTAGTYVDLKPTPKPRKR